MNTIKVTTTQNIEIEYELASLGERILGYLIDRLILCAYLFVILMVLYNGNLFEKVGWIPYLFFLPALLYDLVSEILMNGQSVGKKVMNMKVISLDGAQASIAQYLIRWVFRLVDFSGTFNVCAIITVAVTERKQRVGDLVAGTTLIKTTPRTNFQQTSYTPTPAANYTVTFPEVANLADKDMQLIQEVILRVNTTGNTALASHAAEKIKNTLDLRSDLEPERFLRVLLADYNHLSSQE
ncbi:MAG: RDD family protein [Chitinophagaceae bacterium]